MTRSAVRTEAGAAARSKRPSLDNGYWRLLVGGLLLSTPGWVHAEAWRLTPQFLLQQGYDDNIRLLPDASDTGFETVASAALTLGRVAERSSIDAQLRADHVEFFDNDQVRDEDIFYGNLVGRYRSSERVLWALGVDYRHDFTETTQRIDSASEEDVVDTETALVEEQVRRERLRLSPSWQYALSERASLQLAYGYSEVGYGSGAAQAGLRNFNQQEGSLTLANQWSERTRALVSAGVERFSVPSDAVTEYNYTLVTGLDHAWTELTESRVRLGWRHTRFDEVDGERDEDNGLLLRLEGRRRTEQGRWLASYERRLAGSGSGALLESDIVNLRFEHAFSERTTGQMRARFFRNERLSDEQTGALAERRYLLIEPRLSWLWTPSWTLSFAYRYRWQERDDESGSADSNAVFIAVEFNPLTPDY